MRILTVNNSDINGGAAIAAYRLHRSLLSQGLDAKMLVQEKLSDDSTVIGPKCKALNILTQLRPTVDSLPVRLYRNRSKGVFSQNWLPSSKVLKVVNDYDPDIVHLHWFCGGMMRIEDLSKIKKPIVCSLHDMWLFTGGCHYSRKCDKYTHHCMRCVELATSRTNDLSRKIFRRKLKTYTKKDNMTIVGLSRWLKDCAEKSSLLRDKRVVNLPNPIDTSEFAPIDKVVAKDILGMPLDKKIVLFGAMSATSDERKGFKELAEAFKHIDHQLIELVVFGSSGSTEVSDFGSKIRYMGTLHDEISLKLLYSAADVLVVPSLQENLSNTIVEGQSCATPVAAFDVGGNSDIIDHKTNGYLAQPFQVSDLAKGIEWILYNKKYEEICQQARSKVLEKFDSKLVSQKYIKLYEEILGNN